jgi:hypothetical protein
MPEEILLDWAKNPEVAALRSSGGPRYSSVSRNRVPNAVGLTPGVSKNQLKTISLHAPPLGVVSEFPGKNVFELNPAVFSAMMVADELAPIESMTVATRAFFMFTSMDRNCGTLRRCRNA